MKRKLMAILLALCMLASLTPAIPVAQAAREGGGLRGGPDLSFEDEQNYLFAVDYDMNGGLVFQSVGSAVPTATAADFLPNRFDPREGWPSEISFRGTNGPKTIHLLLDETKALDWEAWDQPEPELRFVDPWYSDERAITVQARYSDGDEQWHEELLLLYGEPADGVSFENNVLSYTPAGGYNVEFRVFWTRSDYEFSLFDRTEDKPIMVEANWWGSGDVCLVDEIPDEDVKKADGRMRIRLPESVQSLTFTWDEYDELRQINVDGLGEDGSWLNGIQPEGNSYTLELNQVWGDGDPRDWYSIQFEFENGGEACAAAFYDQSKGSIFCALGEDAPLPDADHYLDFGFEHSVCFRSEGELLPIHLIFDDSKGLDFEAYDNGEIRFVESTVPVEKRMVGVFAVSDWCMGPVFWDGELTEAGAAQGVSFEGGVLSFQPQNSSDLMLHVYWTQADADFDGFQGTEEYPVVVEYHWWNRGEIAVPEGISEENYMLHADGGSARIRLPLDAESVTFTWAEEYGVRQIRYHVRSSEGDWDEFVQVDQNQPHSFTLQLDQTEMMDGREVPVTWYDLDFEFFEDSRYQLWINWRGSEGNVYFGLNEAPPPVEDSASYDLERYYANKDGECPVFAAVDENGNTEIGKVYLRLDPAHSVQYQAETLTMWDLPEWEGYSPTIYMEYPLEGALGDWFEGPVVVDGQAVSDFVEFRDNVLSFTPVNEQPVMIHILWSREDEAFWNFDTTEDKPVMVELMLGHRVPVSLPADIPAEDVHTWHAAEHDYVRVRVPAERESLVLDWAREGVVALIEVSGAGEDGEPLRIDFPMSTSFELLLNQEEDGWRKEFYDAVFWGYGWDEVPFADVLADAWYHEAVAFAVSMGITAGTSENSFTPDRPLVRAEFVTFLWRLMGTPVPESLDCPFTDVPDNAWYRDPAIWAADSGITAGIGENCFGANERCTRAQVMTLLWRAADSPEPENDSCPFTDVPADAWYYKAVCWAAEQGITVGTSEGVFSPAASCTRAMAVTFLFRCVISYWRAEG